MQSMGQTSQASWRVVFRDMEISQEMMSSFKEVSPLHCGYSGTKTSNSSLTFSPSPLCLHLEERESAREQ